MPRVSEICRYPVKGLSAERLERAALKVGEGLALDRAFALAHAATPFDEGAPEWRDKRGFLMLMANARLAALETAYDEASGVLTIRQGGAEVARGDLSRAAHRAAIEAFVAGHLGEEAREGVKLVQAPGHSFSDVPVKVLSLVNLASIAELERAVGRTVHPVRFRANLYFEGAAPWAEFDWVNRGLAIGSARLEAVDPIARCAATNVDPESAVRDMTIPASLRQHFGHPYMGVYAQVTGEGEIAVGDDIVVG